MSGTNDRRFGVDERAWPLVRAGIVLGLGLGGFFDGIVFHQVLQVHHMLSAHPDAAVAGDLRLNVLADGLFHLATYALTVLGVGLLVVAWRRPDVPPSWRTLVGAALVGWGVFNLAEGTVNHQLLGIHHVWPAGPGGTLVWDAAFLLWGAAMIAAGALLIRGDSTVAAASSERAGDSEDAFGE